jgi:hypothetical protein
MKEPDNTSGYTNKLHNIYLTTIKHAGGKSRRHVSLTELKRFL